MKISQKLSRVRHTQTNCKNEKFFDILERKMMYFKSILEFM